MPNPVAQVNTIRTLVRNGEDGPEYKPAYRVIKVFCPGCKSVHHFTIEVYDNYTHRTDGQPMPVWQWDGNLERPTFSPSMLAYYAVHLCEGEHPPEPCEDPENCGSLGHLVLSKEPKVLGHNTPHTRDPAWGNCHSFLRDGQWEFLSDCAHALAGQTVGMVPLPDWCYSPDPED